MGRLVRTGIDVGGTFTKAVLLDNDSHEIIGQVVVPTTHGAEAGVAEGVIDAFRRALGAAGITAADVVFIAHSTTQATNALLEGDVARVGILGLHGAFDPVARAQVRVPPIRLTLSAVLTAPVRYARRDDRSAMVRALGELAASGVEAVAVSEAFGVDHPGPER